MAKRNRRFQWVPVLLILGILGMAGGPWGGPLPARGKERLKSTHEVSGRVPVQDHNFVGAREKAVSQAMQRAVEQALIQLLGQKKFRSRKPELRRILTHAERYVQSYRFIEAYDDPVNMMSEVLLKVTLYADAVTQALNNLGVISGSSNRKTVLILLKENSFTSRGRESFWETLPISETALTQSFREAGVNVLGREAVQSLLSEDTVRDAVRSDMDATVTLGLKAGADVVIVGNAVSTKRGGDDPQVPPVVQATISVRAVSASQSSVIAAKSDFATARNPDALSGELEAFTAVSKKLSDFLLPSIQRYWEGGAVAKQPAPSSIPPLSVNDL